MSDQIRKRRPQPRKVGYKTPPRHSQFRPGQSGNPNGRPKGRKPVHDLLADILYRPIAITENGRKTRVPAIKALFLRLVRQAIEGDPRAIDKVTKLLPYLEGAGANDNSAEDTAAFDAEADQAVLEAYVRMLQEADGNGEDEL